jgi:rhodanese-related sulfurtransferase
MDNQTGYVILDVRTQEEYDAAHIPGAILIPYDEMENKASAVLQDKNQLILVYCRSGRRSKTAADILVGLGYKVIELDSGYNGWVEAGR